MPLCALVIGDPHFKVSNVRETADMTEKIVALAKERQPDFIVCLGDVLDRHETIHVIPLTKATRFLHLLREIAPLYVVVGNHDRPNNSNFLTDEHPFAGLKHWKNTFIIDQGLVTTIQGHKFLFVPFVPPGRFKEAIKQIIPEDCQLDQVLSEMTCIFAHQEFEGAKMGAICSEVGDPWPLNYPYVISGHIHDYDQLASNLLYTGTPIQHAFGDRDDKTISWVEWPNLDSLDQELQPIIPDHQRIDLGLPKKIIVHLSCTEVADYQPPSNTQLKIIVSGTSAEIKAAMKLSNIKTLISSGIKVVYRDLSTKKIDNLEPLKIRRKKYSELLQNAINDDPELVKVYHKVINSNPKLIVV